jgi:hypothetical protein
MRSFFKHFSYSIHNLIAHPLMEILHLIGFSKLGNNIHNATLPSKHDEDHENSRPDGNHCPSCNSNDISAITRVEHDRGMNECFQTTVCKSCGVRWEEIYELSTIEMLAR